MSAQRPQPVEIIPALQAGDRLTRVEFERRYEAMPHIKKAELIEGVVYMPSPVRMRRHGSPHSHLIGWLVQYEAMTPGVLVGDNVTVRLDDVNEPQPDAVLMIDPARRGQASLGEEDYIEGAPELVAEVSGSSAVFDLQTKLPIYRRNGVREYLVWRVLDQEIDWFHSETGQFKRLAADSAGVLRSLTFPGLWLDAPALLRGEMLRVLEVLGQGLGSPEHAAFVGRGGDQHG